MTTFSLDDVREACKKRDAWWTVFLVDPVAIRLTRLLANRTSITPNQISVAAFLLGLSAAGCFGQGTRRWLVLGAVLYHLGFVLDCCDGKIARLKGTGTLFGQWLDFMFDQVRLVCCALGLAIGQYSVTGDRTAMYPGFMIVSLSLFRYLNSAQVYKTRRTMRRRINAALEEPQAAEVTDDRPWPGDGRRHTYIEDTLRERPFSHPDEAGGAEGQRVIDLHQGFRARFPWYHDVRRYMLRHRVRTHLISGIEFQMAAFIVGPVTGAVAPVTLGAGVLLMMFEAIIIYKFWLSTRECQRILDELAPAAFVPQQQVPSARAGRLA